LAHAAGQDPIAYRRALLDANPRAMAVLKKVADASDWKAPMKPRSGRGVSLHQNFGSYAALVVEVAVALSGEISLRKIVAAVDCGIQINPDIIRAQIEGGVLFGLSAALFNGITFDQGRVQQGNFNDYRQLRINETPSVEVHLLTSNEKPGGIGEVGTVSAAPALANAIFAATGVRIRRLPIDRAQLSKRVNS
jgi:isoquinoline 1-oxidoreductase beta subunit